MTVRKDFGVYRQHWDLFSKKLKLTADLLPVVVDPDAPIAPQSKMKSLGKTPSVLNAERLVVGIPKWTQKTSTERSVEVWANEPRYGICLQSRYVRGLDVDVDDAKEAARIHKAIEDFVKFSLPCRKRGNSPRFLTFFKVKGTLPKRVMPVKGGHIEFLGTGNQFIIAGRHTSGSNYYVEWPDKDDPHVPVLSPERFEDLWLTLEGKFATGDVHIAGQRERRPHKDINDPIVDQLNPLGVDPKDGRVFIECPFKAGHSMDGGIAETCYFPAGTNGYEQGHFNCFHASCKNHDDNAFIEALGLQRTSFDVVPVSDASAPAGRDAAEPADMPTVKRFKDGEIKNTVTNLQAVLERSDLIGWRFGFDNFFHAPMVSRIREDKFTPWRPVNDCDITRLRILLEKIGFRSTDKSMVADVVELISKGNEFDTGKEWLHSLKWDGKERLARFCTDYWGVAYSSYAEAVGKYLFTALAGRLDTPGIKADMAPVLVSRKQGTGKTTSIEAIAPDADFFTEIRLNNNESDLYRQMRGTVIAELSELSGWGNRQVEWVRAFISRKRDKWTPKYKEHSTTYDRRLVFVGTTNRTSFLSDREGNRRWLPLTVVTEADPEAIRRDRNQLWAEGYHLFKKHGVMYQEAEKLAQKQHTEYAEPDLLRDILDEWLHSPCSVSGVRPLDKEYLTNQEVAHVVNTRGGTNRGRSNEVGQAMEGLGYTYKQVRCGSRRLYAWVPNPQ